MTRSAKDAKAIATAREAERDRIMRSLPPNYPLARGVSESTVVVGSSKPVVYRKMAKGEMAAKLLDGHPIIPTWALIDFLLGLPDWVPVAQRKLKGKEKDLDPLIEAVDAVRAERERENDEE